MRWKYLFFDLDGTLTDPMPGITRSVQYALRHFGIEADDPTALCPFIGPPLRNSFREFYDMSDADAEVAVEKYREYYAPKGIFENRLYEGIPSCYATCGRTGRHWSWRPRNPPVSRSRLPGISGSRTTSRLSAAARPTARATPRPT